MFWHNVLIWNNKIFLFWHIFFVSKYFVFIHVCKTNGILNIHVFGYNSISLRSIGLFWLEWIIVNIKLWCFRGIIFSRANFFGNFYFYRPTEQIFFKIRNSKQKDLRRSNAGKLTLLVKRIDHAFIFFFVRAMNVAVSMYHEWCGFGKTTCTGSTKNFKCFILQSQMQEAG